MKADEENYQVVVTLENAKPHQVKMLVDSLCKDYDLDVKEFTVEAFVQTGENAWTAIGFDEPST